MENVCYLRWLSKLINYKGDISSLQEKNFNVGFFLSFAATI